MNLAKLPTPLEEAPRLSDAFGGPRIFFKRDDLTGLALGGIKDKFCSIDDTTLIATKIPQREAIKRRGMKERR